MTSLFQTPFLLRQQKYFTVGCFIFEIVTMKLSNVQVWHLLFFRTSIDTTFSNVENYRLLWMILGNIN